MRKISEDLETRELLIEGTSVGRHLRNLRRRGSSDLCTSLKLYETIQSVVEGVSMKRSSGIVRA